MTIGSDRVRVSFNPSELQIIGDIKQATAKLIDLCQQFRDGGFPEQARCAALAQTHYEEAAMWAVKAATAVTTP